MFSSFQGVDVTVEHNTIHSCARFACYKIGDGSVVTIRNDTIDVPNGHGTQMVLNSGRNDDWTGAGNTVVFEDNVITGSGVGNPVDEATYPSQMGLGVFFGRERAAVERVALNARGVRPFHFDRPDHHGPGNQVDR